MAEPVKSGYTTSEGQLTSVSVIVGAIIALACTFKIIKPGDSDTLTTTLSAAIMGGVALVSNAVKIFKYIQERTKAKSTVTAGMPTEVQTTTTAKTGMP